MGATVKFVNVGAFNSSAGALSVGVPASLQVDDLLLLLVFSGQQTISTPTTTTGTWTEIGDQANQNAGTAGSANNAARLAVYYKFAVANEANASVSDSGNINVAQMIAYRNVDKKDPFAAFASGSQASATTSISFPAVTTTTPDCTIVNCLGNGRDANATNGTSNLTNANLTELSRQFDRTVNTSTGGGVGLFDGILPLRGSSGNTTVTNGGSTVYGYLTLALKPIRRIIAYT